MLVPELAGCDELSPPKRPPVGAGVDEGVANREFEAAGVVWALDGFGAKSPPPKAPALLLGFAGGGPAGVVEGCKLNLAGAGVVEPVGALEEALPVPPNKPELAGLLCKFPNSPPVDAEVVGLFSVVAGAVVVLPPA